MRILVQPIILHAIETHGEQTYPNEGAGFLYGWLDGDSLMIARATPAANQREQHAQHNRYELSAEDFMRAELEAERTGADIVGVFHSHPDNPAQPSQFDLDHALPNFSYLITAIEKGQAQITRAWRLRGDRTAFDEDELVITNKADN